ncbi:hypothetical protein [Pseudomonas aeruginosa]|uniref:hypothetical protein n=1 Tax=Pseudomonas aeruginosa TaxID=287 RepID=UPI000FC40CB7|nr:hypothetical protein [Pseudomonas aeruginosa]MDO2901754.1 hypothetical protein [Pseudomonas aeruginosa]RUB11946.1 hypothetical protein IPC1616_30490 [Pseudomonas aeruginosa]
MSILNRENDGLHPIVLTLAGIVAREKVISRDELISICVPHASSEMEAENDSDKGRGKALAARARATLARWVSLGLFIENDDQVRLSVDLARGESTY